MNKYYEFIGSVRRENFAEVKVLYKDEYLYSRRYNTYSALHEASMFNKGSVVIEYLIEKGFNEEEEEACYGYNCVHIAARDGKVDILKTLLQRGCDVDSKSKGGLTAVNLAVLCGEEECVNLLREYSTAEEESLVTFDNIFNDMFLVKLEDEISVENIHNCLQKHYDNKCLHKSSSVSEDEIIPFLLNTIAGFNKKHKDNLFQKIKRKEKLEKTEQYLINCVAFSISIIGQCKTLTKEDKQNVIHLIIDYLEELFDSIRQNSTATRLEHILLYTFFDIIRIDHSYEVNMKTFKVLWRFFALFHYNEHIKLSSGASLLFLYNRGMLCHQEEFKNVIKYIEMIINKGKYLGEYLGFSVNVLQKLIKDGSNTYK